MKIYGVRYENEDIGNRPIHINSIKMVEHHRDRLSYDKYFKTYNSRVQMEINQYYVYFRPNIAGDWGQEINYRGVLSENRQWKWEPSNSRIIDYDKWIYLNLENGYHLDEDSFIQFQTQDC